MALKLLVETPGASISRYEFVLDQNRVTVGRSTACDVQLPLGTISSHHLTILREGDQYLIADMGSTNGTWIEHRRLTPDHYTTLTDGTRLSLVDLTITVHLPQTPIQAMTPAQTGELVRQMVLGVLRQSHELEETAASLEVIEGPERGQRRPLPSDGGRVAFGPGGTDWALGDEALVGLWVEGGAEATWLHRGPQHAETVRLDGEKLQGSGPWRLESGARLRAGRTTLLFIDPLESYLKGLETPPETPGAEPGPPTRRPTQEVSPALLKASVASLASPTHTTAPATPVRGGTRRVKRGDIEGAPGEHAHQEPALAEVARAEAEALGRAPQQAGWTLDEKLLLALGVVLLLAAIGVFLMILGVLPGIG